MAEVRLVPFVCVGVIEMIVNTTKFTVPSEKRTEFLQSIGPLLEPIKSAKGCRDFSFYVEAADENSTLLVSEWETESDLNNYLGSNDFAILRGAITVLSVQSIDSKTNVTPHLYKP
jgi:quinol monooxygenase YgiN